MRSTIRVCILLVVLIQFHHLKAQEWENFTAESHALISNHIKSICVDGHGIKWFGTDSGLCRFDDSTFHTFQRNPQEKQTLADNRINVITEDLHGTFWFGTLQGVSSFNGKTWQTLTINEGLVSNNVLDIALDVDGSLWFATNHGISHYSGNITSIKFEDNPVSSFQLHPNYPNPFNSSTVIPFSIEKEAWVRLSIYNILGQEIVSLVNRQMKHGYHQVVWDVDGLESGLYFYELKLGHEKKLDKCLYIK